MDLAIRGVATSWLNLMVFKCSWRCLFKKIRCAALVVVLGPRFLLFYKFFLGAFGPRKSHKIYLSKLYNYLITRSVDVSDFTTFAKCLYFTYQTL